MFEYNQVAAIMTFVALGANFLGAALLLLFNPRSRAVRWFSVFAVTQLIWLLLQGLLLLDAVPNTWWRAYTIDVHFMPAFFFAAVLVQRYNPRFVHMAPIAAAIVVMGLVRGIAYDGVVLSAWQVCAWGAPALLYRRSTTESLTVWGRRLGLFLSGIVPVAVLASVVTGGGFVLYLLPMLTVGIQFLIFTGVVYHRYYDIEVRAARSGELAASAAEQDRLALLGELSATIAHEVRNPLTGIKSLTQLIADEPLDDARRARYTGVILEEIERLDRIVGNLVNLSRRTSAGPRIEPVNVSLRDLFEDLVMLVEPRARRAGLTLRVEHGDIRVRTQRDALAQALLNLLLNAITHSPQDGSIILEARREDGRVVVSTTDSGPGVRPEDQDRIFEAFQTSGGVGLGLTVVRRLAIENGWALGVRNVDSAGAEFSISMADAQ